MKRGVGRIVIEVVVTIAVAWLLGAFLLVALNVPDAFVESARRLFLFMDIGLGVWVLLLIVAAVRGRNDTTRARPGIRATLLFALIGAVANFATVTVVGFAQTGALPVEFLGFATTSGLTFLLAAAIVVPYVHRVGPFRARR